MKNVEGFDITLSKDCAKAFSKAVQLGTVVSLADGNPLAAFGGYHCENCQVCALAGRDHTQCIQAHIWGMTEAKRFGGKYIYVCPMGLTFFTSPIIGSDGAKAKITVGPFLMIERQDYIANDLLPKLQAPQNAQLLAAEIEKIPEVPAPRVESMSSLMFMAVGFLNDVWAANNMLEVQESYAIQKQISSYISALKNEKKPTPYPLEKEGQLLDCIAHLDRQGADRYLNELLGYIFFSTGGDIQLAKSRTYELLVLISRTAIKHGADAKTMMQMTHDFMQIIPKLASMDELCSWLAKSVNSIEDSLFEYADVKHTNVIYQATTYIREHCAEHLTLDTVAQEVFLSPSYFSRIFRKETGETFNAYLNRIRIEQSKKLLMDKSNRLIDISLMVGFDNQSYFTKVFKKIAGVSPMQYREKNCKDYSASWH